MGIIHDHVMEAGTALDWVRVGVRVNQDEVAMSAWRVHWTGLHRPLDSTAGMVSMTRTRMLGRQERGVERSRERAREARRPR